MPGLELSIRSPTARSEATPRTNSSSSSAPSTPHRAAPRNSRFTRAWRKATPAPGVSLSCIPAGTPIGLESRGACVLWPVHRLSWPKLACTPPPRLASSRPPTLQGPLRLARAMQYGHPPCKQLLGPPRRPPAGGGALAASPTPSAHQTLRLAVRTAGQPHALQQEAHRSGGRSHSSPL
eukprot:scaffold2299_cov359-Prasinococcus_capsulatus_cf.AAC.6